MQPRPLKSILSFFAAFSLVMSVISGLGGCGSKKTFSPEGLPGNLKSAMVGELPIVYSDQGQGVPIVIFSSYPLGTAAWTELAALLSRSFRVIVIEPPGFRNPGAMKGNFSSENILQIYRKFFRTIKLRKAHLLGAGEGGAFAFAFGHHFPEHSLSATSINGYEAAPASPDVLKGLNLTYSTSTRKLRLLLSTASLRYRGMPPGKKGMRDLFEMTRLEKFSDTAEARRQALIQDMRGAFFPSMIETVYFPVLLIQSEKNEMLDAKYGERALARIESSFYRAIPQAGHFAFLDHPKQVDWLIRDFIENPPGPLQ